ncbi:prolipoprotein diacylglyceryl transferase [Gordonia paraffinivorans]|uniref:prolipoprotein diacylglyceryl transferase n=1 Tax=Gordonia paraffinivorans TaxID=175628 RepID=UPI0014475E84|nr:prolipoprotein diacylglyceryl transferase [Gordonia paraffinivorans]
MISPTTTMLAYIPSPPQGVWNLGPFPLRAYALCIIVGIIVAVWWGNRRWVARGGQEGEVLDVAIWAVPFGLVGGRLYHLITDWRTYFGADAPKEPLDALRIWDGGLGIWGAVALGAVGAWIGARRRGIRLSAFGDAIAPPILLAQAIGRLGNYFNQELYGRETTLPWGLEIYERVNDSGYADPGLIDGVSNGVVVAVVQPTFLYELLWNVLVVIALVLIDRTFRIGHGRLFALYIAGYCLGRFFIEMLRDDRAAVANDIAGIRPNLFTAALVFLAAIVYFVLAPKGREQGLEMYHPERAAELEEEGVAGYVDDWYEEDWDADEVDAATEVDADTVVDDGPVGTDPGVAVADDEPADDEPAADDAAETIEIEPEGAVDETVELASSGTADDAVSDDEDVATDSDSTVSDGTDVDAEAEADEAGTSGAVAEESEAGEPEGPETADAVVAAVTADEVAADEAADATVSAEAGAEATDDAGATDDEESGDLKSAGAESVASESAAEGDESTDDATAAEVTVVDETPDGASPDAEPTGAEPTGAEPTGAEPEEAADTEAADVPVEEPATDGDDESASDVVTGTPPEAADDAESSDESAADDEPEAEAESTDAQPAEPDSVEDGGSSDPDKG